MNSPPGSTGRFGAGVLTALFGVLVVVLFAAIYFAQPGQPFTALWEMGIVALLLGLLCFFLQALSRDPSVQRAMGWGLGAAGFALLFGTIWAGPSDPLTFVWRLYLSIPLLLVLILAVVFANWRVQTMAVTERRLEHRAAWDASTPPSAFEYAAAKQPGTSPGGTPPSDPAAPTSNR